MFPSLIFAPLVRVEDCVQEHPVRMAQVYIQINAPQSNILLWGWCGWLNSVSVSTEGTIFKPWRIPKVKSYSSNICLTPSHDFFTWRVYLFRSWNVQFNLRYNASMYVDNVYYPMYFRYIEWRQYQSVVYGKNPRCTRLSFLDSLSTAYFHNRQPKMMSLWLVR